MTDHLFGGNTFAALPRTAWTCLHVLSWSFAPKPVDWIWVDTMVPIEVLAIILAHNLFIEVVDRFYQYQLTVATLLERRCADEHAYVCLTRLHYQIACSSQCQYKTRCANCKYDGFEAKSSRIFGTIAPEAQIVASRPGRPSPAKLVLTFLWLRPG